MQHYGDGTDNSGNNLCYFNCIRQGWKKEADCIYTIPTAWIWTDGGVYVTGNKLNVDLSYGYATDMWLVDDFYNYQVLKEVVNEF